MKLSVYIYVILVTIFCFLFFANVTIRKDRNKCIKEIFQRCENCKSSEANKRVIENEFGETTTYDSVCYTIRSRKKNNGLMVYHAIENTCRRILFNRDYHDNGRIKSEGFLLIPNHTMIGTWIYYSEKKYMKVDSIVDIEKSRRVKYCEFINVDKVKSLLSSNSNIEYGSEGWSITEWKDNKMRIKLVMNPDTRLIQIDTLIAFKHSIE